VEVNGESWLQTELHSIPVTFSTLANYNMRSSPLCSHSEPPRGKKLLLI